MTGADESPETQAKVQSPAEAALFADRFELVREVGRGGMGTVFLARDANLNEEVALKLLALPDGGQEEAVERFRREVRLARRITHPNVARVHDLGEADGRFFFTMEFVPGASLHTVMHREVQLPVSQACRIASGIAKGLAAAHRAGVIHRDLKPANVLLRDGEPVVTDFGIARPIEGTNGLTIGAIGTPMYMSPEQVSGEGVDERSDIYSLALVLFEMLAGQPPFGRSNHLVSAAKRITENAPSLSVFGQFPEPLVSLVDLCLSTSPASRPRDALAVHRALTPFITGSSTMAPQPVITPSVVPSPASTIEERALAVLPLVYRGDPELDYFADALTEELVDLLSHTRGLRVLASGASERFRTDRDPLKVGRELNCDAVVDGSVQAMGGKLRVGVRLVNARSGVVIWSERINTDLSDLFTVQERMSRRIAEELRVRITTDAYGGTAPEEAVMAYLKARRKMKINKMELAGPDGAVALLKRVTELAPDFQPAVSALAIATTRTWFILEEQDGNDWRALSIERVADAAERAPDLAETTLAEAMLAHHLGSPKKSMLALRHALDLAPTSADAHEYLGRLHIMAGRPEVGLRHLRLSVDLDPRLMVSRYDMARYFALCEDREAFDREVAALDEGMAPTHPLGLMLKVRAGAWFGDEDLIRPAMDHLRVEGSVYRAILLGYSELMLGERDPGEVIEQLQDLESLLFNPRLRAMFLKIKIEALGHAGLIDEALNTLQLVGDGPSLDLEWIDRCSLLEPLRVSEAYQRARRKVRIRAEAVWTG